MWTRKELKDRSKLVMKRNYWIMFIVAFLFVILTGGLSDASSNTASQIGTESIHVNIQLFKGVIHMPVNWNIIEFTIMKSTLIIIGILVAIGAFLYGFFVGNPIECGKCRFFLQNTETNQSVSVLFSVFSKDYLNVVKVLFLRDIKIILWTLLFVIPGIIKSIEYSMIPYLLAEDPSMRAEEAFSKSKEMTSGQKWNIFVLSLSFIGWLILGSLLVIGTLFVNPYVYATEAELYKTLKQNNNTYF